MTTLTVTPIATIKALVDLLADLDVTPLHLHTDGREALDGRPDIRLWTTTRTDFTALCDALDVKKRTEARYDQPGQRSFQAEHDTAERRLLIQCVSFEHHDDWQAKPGRGAA